MRVLWMLIKIILGLAIAIPLGVLALALTLGLVGTLVGIAILVLKLACVGLVGYGLYRVCLPGDIWRPGSNFPLGDSL